MKIYKNDHKRNMKCGGRAVKSRFVEKIPKTKYVKLNLMKLLHRKNDFFFRNCYNKSQPN